MTEEPFLEATDPPKKLRKFVMLIAILILTASSFTLIRFVITGNFPCDICFDYPSWWTYFYPVKNLLAITSAILFWKWKRVGAYGLMLVGLINAASQIGFEYNIITGVASIISIGAFYLAIKDDWSDYG
jgi:hypothetical protein